MPSKKPIETYISEIKELHFQLKEHTDSESLHRKLYSRLSSFADLINITVFVAPQEQMPWVEKDLGYPTKPMLTKKEFKVAQTGDYQAYYQIPGKADWIPILIERKGGKIGVEDIYQTLSNKESRETFYREIVRFKEDSRFSCMYLIAECTFEDYLKYVPPFNGRERNRNHIAVSVETRRATIAGLYIRGCNVIFAGSRARAIQMYRDLIRQWVMKNYVSILDLDKEEYNDSAFLKKRLAQLEIEIKTTKAAIEGYDVERLCL